MSKREIWDIDIGSIITTIDGIRYKVLDNSLISTEFPISILDIENDKIVINSYGVNYMNIGRYVYIDNKEVPIVSVEY